MNNDFNYTPKKTDTPVTPVNEAPQAEPELPPEEPVTSPQEVHTSPQPSGKGKTFLKFLGLLLLLALIGGGVWYWQQMRIQKLASSHARLESKVSSLESQLDEKRPAETQADKETPAAAAAAYDVVTGDYSFNATDKKESVEVLYLPDTASEVWVEYGTKPGELKTLTTKVKGTGTGSAGVYVSQAVNLPDLQDGTRYYYRAAATVDGKTVYGGVVSFQAAK